MKKNDTLPPMYFLIYPNDTEILKHLTRILKLYDENFNSGILDLKNDGSGYIYVLDLANNRYYFHNPEDALHQIRRQDPMFTPAQFSAQVVNIDLNYFMEHLHK